MFSLPKLAYSYNALEPYLDRETLQIHYLKHHGTYVDNLNKVLTGHDEFLNMGIDELLQKLNRVPEEIRTSVKRNSGQHANHSLFWQIMGPKKEEPRGKLLKVINKSFGSFAGLKEKFSLKAISRFGSGWVWLVFTKGNLSITDTVNEESPAMEGKAAILTLDVWEHAYYLKYQNRRAEYIKAWWNIVNWQEVERRFNEINRQ